MNQFCNLICKTNPTIFHANGIPQKSPLWEKIKNLCNNNIIVPNNLHIVTFNNGSSSHNKDVGSLENSIKNKCTVMGSDIKEWNNVKKISLIIDFLKLNKTEYILSCDSSDVVIFSLDKIIEKFLNKSCEILFNAEKNVWPRGYNNEKEWFREPFCYLNAGVCIGKRESMLQFYEQCLSLIMPNDQSEQKIVKQTFYKWYPKILIDDDCSVFQTLNGITEGVLLIPEKD
jgi:hypothetical protein